MSESGTDPRGIEITDEQVLRSRFWRKYMRLTRAGVPVLGALDIIREETIQDSFAEVLAEMIAGIEGGAPLSKTMSRDSFSLTEIEMIRTAEKRGAWDEILEELADGLLDGCFDIA